MARLRSSGGFSLVEMVAAVLIFSLGVTAMLGVFAESLRSTATSADYTRAVFLAQGLMEEVLADDDVEAGELQGEFEDAFPGAWWQRTIEETDTEDLYEVRVEVGWPERGQERTVALVSLAARR
jgi:general secretion pathway protein I